MIFSLKASNIEAKEKTSIKAVKSENAYQVFLDSEELIGEVNSNLLILPEYKGKVTKVAGESLELKIYTSVPIHVHSEYSLLDGAIRMNDLISSLDYTGALTDHGVMYGFLEFYKGMLKAKKKPVLGLEAYVKNIDGKKQTSHLILLAKNETGLRNLMKLSSEAFYDFYKKPHVSMENLEKYSEGVIATSACISGELSKAILADDMARANKIISKYVSIFGKDNFFIEIQRHGFEDEETVNPHLISLAKDNGIGLVATSDSHYLRKEDAYAHEILLCLQTGKTMNEHHMTFSGTDYHLLSCEEMEKKFADIPEALANSIRIADMCNVQLALNNIQMPVYEIPQTFSNETEYFNHLCEDGFKSRFSGTAMETSEEYLSRLKYEMDMISYMKFEKYFLIVWDFLNYARSQDIAVGPGRGSAAGSLVAFCLGITDIDPIPYGLLFERFLNPERVSWPDIDSDIEDDRRDEVIDYLTRKYGENNVCNIITFGRMKAKMVVKDVARALGHEPYMGAQIAKLVPDELKMTLSKALDANPELKNLYDSDNDVKHIVDIGKTLEGLARHSSVHACGFVTSPSAVTDWIPTVMTKDDKTNTKIITSQVTMAEVEELGLLKMDVLGLRTLTIIKNTLNQIRDNYGVSMRMIDIPLDDRATYKTLSKGDTLGVFQLESPGMIDLITKMYADIDSIPNDQLSQCFERAIAAVALYRPGPMEYIPAYLDNMKHPDSIAYDHSLQESILKATYGQIVYQEQVMQIVQKLAGYTLGRADIVRKGMAKKKTELLDSEETVFVNGNNNKEGEPPVPGCVNNGISREVAEGIWAKMKSFGAYAFNKSHAAAYAAIAVKTGWLKTHYPLEFYTATINSVLDKSDILRNYLVSVKKAGYQVLPPSVNSSTAKFAVVYEDNKPMSIRFGLQGLMGINTSASAIEVARGDIPFKDIEDLTERLGRNGGFDKKGYEALILSGSADCLPGTRLAKVEAISKIVAETSFWKQINESPQISLFETNSEFKQVSHVDISNPNEYPKQLLYKQEKEVAGVYITGNPLSEFSQKLNGKKNMISLEEFQSAKEKKEFLTYGIISNSKIFISGKGPIAVFTLENEATEMKCICYSEAYESVKGLIVKDKMVVLKGKRMVSEKFGEQIVTTTLFDIEEYCKSDVVPKQIFVKINNKREQDSLLELVTKNHGKDSEIVILAKEKEYPLNNKVRYSLALNTSLENTFEEVRAVY